MYDGGDWGALDLPSDPVRGDPGNVRALATFAQRESQYWRDHTESLRTTSMYGNSMAMEGDFAPKYRDHLADLPVRSGAMRDAHEQAGQALGQYGQVLERAKDQSRVALRQGVQAKEQRDQAIRANKEFRAQQNALPKVVYSEAELAWVREEWYRLDAMAERAWAAAQAAEEQRMAARQQAIQAGEEATAAESACAQTVRGAAPQSAAVQQRGRGSSLPAVPASTIQDLWKVNPNFNQSQPSFSVNCSHCVQAYELRRRGFDVEARAMPEAFHAKGGPPLKYMEETWGRKFTAGTRADLENAFAQDGSRGAVAVRMRNGGGHLFTVENIGGRVRFLDSQNGIVDVDYHFNNAHPINPVRFLRWDDLPTPQGLGRFVVPRAA
jgi:hypothetical protein